MKFEDGIINQIYQTAMYQIDDVGTSVVYVADTKPEAHVWTRPKEYANVPEGVTKMWSGKRGDAVGRSLQAAFRRLGESEDKPPAGTA